MDIKTIINRYEQAKTKRQPYETLWQDICDYIMPTRSFTKTHSPGENRNGLILDNSGGQAHEELSGGLHGMLTGEAIKWFTLGLEDDDTPDDEATRWLDIAGRMMLARAYNNPASNFGSAAHEVYLETTLLGTTALFQRRARGSAVPCRFQAVSLSQIYIEEGADGKVNTLYRCRDDVTVSQLIETFGIDRVSKKTRDDYQKDPHKIVKVLHAVFPRNVYDPRKSQTSNKDMPFASFYIEIDSEHVLEESGYQEFPYHVPRWKKQSGDLYGMGQGYVALPDVKMLQAMMQTTIEAGQLSVRPPLQVPDEGFLTPISWAPNALNYYRTGRLGPDDRIQPIETGARPDFGEEMMQGVRERIRSAFFVDWLRLPQRPDMTATEVLQRRNDIMRLLSPMLGRMQSELLGPMIDRTFNIMMDEGLFPKPPESLQGKQIKVVYQSPISQAQRSGELEGIMQTYGFMGQLAQIDQSVLAYAKSGEALRQIGILSGAPLNVIATDDEAQQKLEQQQQAQQAQAETAMAQQAAAAAKDGAQAIDTIQKAQAGA